MDSLLEKEIKPCAIKFEQKVLQPRFRVKV